MAIILNIEKCINCHTCVKSCPVGAIHLVYDKGIIDKEKCIKCGICITKCMMQAISHEDTEKRA